MSYLVGISLLALSFNVLAFSWDRAKLLSCESFDQSMMCGESCKPSNLTIEFKVNEKNNVVISSIYEGEKLYSSEVFNKCQIVDDKNWKCSTISLSEGSHISASMLNGKAAIKEFYPLKMKTIYRCAK